MPILHLGSCWDRVVPRLGLVLFMGSQQCTANMGNQPLQCQCSHDRGADCGKDGRGPNSTDRASTGSPRLAHSWKHGASSCCRKLNAEIRGRCGRRGIGIRRRCHRFSHGHGHCNGGCHRGGHGHRGRSSHCLCSTGQSGQQSCCRVEECDHTRAGHVCFVFGRSSQSGTLAKRLQHAAPSRLPHLETAAVSLRCFGAVPWASARIQRSYGAEGSQSLNLYVEHPVKHWYKPWLVPMMQARRTCTRDLHHEPKHARQGVCR